MYILLYMWYCLGLSKLILFFTLNSVFSVAVLCIKNKYHTKLKLQIIGSIK